jgi:hypothetical protein
MKQKKRNLLFAVLALSHICTAQNVGIGIDTPKAKLDVNGSLLIRGANANSFTPQTNAVEFFFGKSGNGTFPPGVNNADIAFNWGGAGGGFRHVLSSRHHPAIKSDLNALDFYINNTNLQNDNPTVNSPNLSITAIGTKIYKDNYLELGAGITKEANAGKIGYQLFSPGLDIIGAGTTQDSRRITFYNEGAANFLGRVAIGTTSVPAEKLYVDGNVKVETDVTISGKLGIGVNVSTATNKLEVAGNILAAGNFMMGLEYKVVNHSLTGGNIVSFDCFCSTGKKVIGGGAGHRDFNAAQGDITVNFTGPIADGSGWHALLKNSSGQNRQVQVWAICARVQ